MKTMTKKQIETAKKVIIAMLATAEAPTAENISKYIKKVSSENKAMYIEYITTALKTAEAEQTAEQEAEEAEQTAVIRQKKNETIKHRQEILNRQEAIIKLQEEAIKRNTEIYNTMRKYGYSIDVSEAEQEAIDYFMNTIAPTATAEEQITADNTIDDNNTISEQEAEQIKTADFFN